MRLETQLLLLVGALCAAPACGGTVAPDAADVRTAALSNGMDDDSDGTVDETDEGLDEDEDGEVDEADEHHDACMRRHHREKGERQAKQAEAASDRDAEVDEAAAYAGRDRHSAAPHSNDDADEDVGEDSDVDETADEAVSPTPRGGRMDEDADVDEDTDEAADVDEADEDADVDETADEAAAPVDAASGERAAHRHELREAIDAIDCSDVPSDSADEPIGAPADGDAADAEPAPASDPAA